MDAFVRGLESFTNNTLLTGFREIDELVQAGGLPDGLEGVTFEFDIGTGKYKQSAEPGAPVAGSRFLLYGVSPDRQFLPTLDEVGYIDLLNQGSGARRQVRLVASLTGTTVADYIGWAEGDEDEGGFGLKGWVIMAGHRVDFDLGGTSAPSTLGRRDSLDAMIALDDRNYLVDGNLVLDGDGTAAHSALSVDYRSRGGAAKLAGGSDGTTATRTVSLNGEAYANSSQPAGSSPSYVGVAPHEVTGEEAVFFSELEALNDVSVAMAVWTVQPLWRRISADVLFNQSNGTE